MKKKVLALTAALGIILGGTVANASPISDFDKGALEIEFGSTLNSSVSGKGTLHPSADGKEGFKYGVAYGLGNNTALLLKGGKFKSEDATVALGAQELTTYAKSDIRELDVVYKLTDNVSAAVGYVENTISYGKYVNKEKASSLHVGLIANKKINDSLKAFTGVMVGNDVLYWEAGLGIKLAEDTNLNVAYGEREFNNVAIAVPVANFKDVIDYKMKGITFMLSHKIK